MFLPYLDPKTYTNPKTSFIIHQTSFLILTLAFLENVIFIMTPTLTLIRCVAAATPEKTAAILEEECKRFRSQYEGHTVAGGGPAAYPAMWAAATKWGAAVTTNNSNTNNSSTPSILPAIKQEKQSVPHLLAEMVEQQQQHHQQQQQQHPHQQQQQHPQSPAGGTDSPYPASFFNSASAAPNSAEALYESMSQVYPALTSSLGENF